MGRPAWGRWSTAGWSRLATDALWSRWVPVVFVPAVVAATHVVAQSSVALRFLLVPPLAVLAERGAAEPDATSSRLGSMVVGPAVGALLGTTASVGLPRGPATAVGHSARAQRRSRSGWHPSGGDITQSGLVACST